MFGTAHVRPNPPPVHLFASCPSPDAPNRPPPPPSVVVCSEVIVHDSEPAVFCGECPIRYPRHSADIMATHPLGPTRLCLARQL